MRRRSTFSLLVALLLVLATAAAATASNHRRTDRTGHAFVGLWLVDADIASPMDPPTLATISQDGTIRISDCCNSPSAGVWAPSGRRGVEITVLLPWGDEDGFVGFNTLRGAAELSADGDAFTATYTMDLPIRDGGTSGQLGPVTANGVRVNLEPMGEPVGPLPDELTSPAEPDGQPEASAAPEASPST